MSICISLCVGGTHVYAACDMCVGDVNQQFSSYNLQNAQTSARTVPFVRTLANLSMSRTAQGEFKCIIHCYCNIALIQVNMVYSLSYNKQTKSREI